jgi:dihydroxy-acid dehydratase
MSAWRSKSILKQPEFSMHRALWKSMGYSDYDLARPMIGVANSWNRVVPGHYNLNLVSDYVKQGILQAGGTPVEFGVMAPCDGIAQSHDGMHYILPSRDLIANDVEMMTQAHRLDAVVLLCSCDKIVPGMLMGAARVDIPSIMVVGGPMEGGCDFDGRAADTTALTEGLGMLSAGTMDEETYLRLEDTATPTCGSCSFLGTANTMCAVAEALGMCLPGSAAIPATYADRLRSAQASGRRIVEMVHDSVTARDIINRESLENAIRLATAIGGSTNIALHFPAIAYEAECEITMDELEALCSTTPHIARIFPSAAPNVPDFHTAGGVPAVMKQLLPLIHTDALTVNGRTMGENAAEGAEPEGTVIRSAEKPWSASGGIAVLKGNLAPDTGITKPAAIVPEMHTFTGKAHCFDSEEAANTAILGGEVQAGEVVVIRYEGPKGGPGMREMYAAMKLLYGRGLALSTAVVTDGRFSGTNNGCFVGHVSPEAAEGGPLAIVEDGDTITIDVPNRGLHLGVSDEEIAERLSKWKRRAPKFKRGYLALYSRLATSANRGAVIENRFEE